ncbi:MAG: hypothetical protein MR533_00620 [Prevotella sp.]|nr:hypothetical protein [Prevotella sp.]
MKKEYIKPIIINIKICNDDALCQMQRASLFEINKSDSVNIAVEDDNVEPTTDGGIIWND